jgi:hypothetical protein
MKKNLFFLFTFTFFYSLSAQKINKGNILILYTPGHPSNVFIPSKNIGGAIDGHFKGDIDDMLTSKNIREMKTVGLKPVSYRLRTELGDEVWHWNPKGRWSDSSNHEGYWISDSESTKPINISNGYKLPRRGNTFDQANDRGYSRISDGDTSTFWKSNPYLDEYFTKESNTLHPQWVIVDLGKLKQVNAIRIKWGNPYPLSFKIDYAEHTDPAYFDPYQTGIWKSFPDNIFENEKGENKIIKMRLIKKIRFLRISFTESSHTTNHGSDDIRDQLGFAVKEMQVGFVDKKGKFYDWMKHAANHSQSTIYVSSTDPWHCASDIDENVEQVGIDRFFKSGITSDQPALMPAALLYDTPDNVLAMIRYMKAKNYPVDEMEMGEEPEGQLISPTDYAALYHQLGIKIRKIDPSMRLGGPGFASISFTKDDSTTFTESKWTKLFLNYLKEHNSIDLFNFFSFEWYPFDDLCKSSAAQLAIAPEMLSTALKNFQNNILPQNTPLYLTEYGYSASEGSAEVEMEGGLMYADILGEFLEMGGSKNFLYGYEPAFLQEANNCGFGNNMLFGLDSNNIKYKTAAFFCMQIFTHFWAQPADSLLEVYPFSGTIKNRKQQSLVVSYALHKPNGEWSVMLINKDPKRIWNVNVSVENTITKNTIEWHPQHLIQYSKQQYHWLKDGINSHPSKELPPVIKKMNRASNISLAPYSLTIIY